MALQITTLSAIPCTTCTIDATILRTRSAQYGRTFALCLASYELQWVQLEKRGQLERKVRTRQQYSGKIVKRTFGGAATMLVQNEKTSNAGRGLMIAVPMRPRYSITLSETVNDRLATWKARKGGTTRFLCTKSDAAGESTPFSPITQKSR
jgi:hypothetical protein